MYWFFLFFFTMEANFPHNHMLPGAGTLGPILRIDSTGIFRHCVYYEEAGRNLYVGRLTEHSYKLLQ